MAKSKLGFHTGPGGKKDGLGNWERALNSAGQPFGLKATDEYGPIFEAVNIGRQHNIQNWLGFRFTEKAGRISREWPDYNAAPWEDAPILCQELLSKLPPEFDKSVWLEPINEPRDENSDARDTMFNDMNATDYLGEWCLAAAKFLKERGYKFMGPSFNAGRPGRQGFPLADAVAQYSQPGMLKFLRYCADNPDQAALSVHDYSGSRWRQPGATVTDWYPALWGRFEAAIAAADLAGIPRTFHIFVTEFGFAHNEAPQWPEVRPFLEARDRMLARWPQVKYDAGWTLQAFIGDIDKHVNSWLNYNFTQEFDEGEQPARTHASFGGTLPGDKRSVKPQPSDLIEKPVVPTLPTAVTIKRVTGTKRLYMRTGPSAEHTIIQKLPKGTAVEVLEEGVWDQIRVGGVTGYVNSRFLSADASPPTARTSQLFGLSFTGWGEQDVARDPAKAPAAWYDIGSIQVPIINGRRMAYWWAEGHNRFATDNQPWSQFLPPEGVHLWDAFLPQREHKLLNNNGRCYHLFGPAQPWWSRFWHRLHLAPGTYRLTLDIWGDWVDIKDGRKVPKPDAGHARVELFLGENGREAWLKPDYNGQSLLKREFRVEAAGDYDIGFGILTVFAAGGGPGANGCFLRSFTVERLKAASQSRPSSSDTPTDRPAAPPDDKSAIKTKLVREGLRLRRAPVIPKDTSEDNVIYTMPAGEIVEVLEEGLGEGGIWDHIRVGGVTGYASSQFLSPSQAGDVKTRRGPIVTPGQYSGPRVDFVAGIHGPGDAHTWHDPNFRNMLVKLGMPVKFMSDGDRFRWYGEFRKPALELVRVFWSPDQSRRKTAQQAWEEDICDGVMKFYNQGARHFEVHNEPRLGKEGMGSQWKDGNQFGDFLRGLMLIIKKHCREAKLWYPGESPGVPWTDQFAFSRPAYQKVADLCYGVCQHAYSGNTGNVDAAVNDIVYQVRKFHEALQAWDKPIIVSECSVNRAASADFRAKVYTKVSQELRRIPGVQGVFWYVAHWNAPPNEVANAESWYGTELPELYKRLNL